MEVWLESLSMHLSVGMPLPSDLLFDIYHYRGISPCSSGSTTPEGIPSGHRSPTLEPIREGKLATQKTSDVKTKIAEKSVIKVSSVESLGDHRTNELYTRSCEDFAKNLQNSPKIIETDPNKFPNYENIDFLKNDSVFVRDKETKEKEISLKKLGDKKQLNVDKNANTTENNLKGSKFPVQLRKVPKNFTRNRFIKETTAANDLFGKIRCETEPIVEKPQKVSNLSLHNIKTTSPSRVTQKYVQNTTIKPEIIPDVVSSTLKTCGGTVTKSSPPPTTTFSISRSIFKRTDEESDQPPKLTRQAPIARGRQTPILGRKIFSPRDTSPTTTATTPKPNVSGGTSSLVRNIIDSLNRKDRGGKFESGGRGVYGRSSLKTNRNPRTDTSKTLRSSSPEEFTAL